MGKQTFFDKFMGRWPYSNDEVMPRAGEFYNSIFQ